MLVSFLPGNNYTFFSNDVSFQNFWLTLLCHLLLSDLL